LLSVSLDRNSIHQLTNHKSIAAALSSSRCIAYKDVNMAIPWNRSL